jgi:hypothetical protein
LFLLKLVKTIVAHIFWGKRGVVSGLSVRINGSSNVPSPLVLDFSLPHHHIDIFL